MLPFKEKSVAIGDIDVNDDFFRITTDTDIENLSISIRSLGLINPPFLIKKKSEFAVVSGFRRIAVCKRIKLTPVKARVILPGTSRLACVKLAIADNAAQRAFNLIEQSRAVKALSACCKDNVYIDEAESIPGLPGNRTVLNKIKDICLFPRSIQNGILEGVISLSTALELAELGEDAGVALANVFKDLKLSLNKQREIITLIKEIAIRENTLVIKILCEDFLQNILKCDKLDRTRKTQKIRHYLKLRRFPSIVQAEEEFAKHVKALKLGEGIKLIPPKNFEGSAYCLNLYFTNFRELIDRKVKLEKIISNPGIGKILD